MNTLSVVLYAALLIAVVASVAAIVSPRLRTRLLVVAATFYAVAGVLGIVSIGVVFLLAAVLCFAVAAREKLSAPPPAA